MVNCANCRTANPDGAKFCLNCGTKLTLACPNCGAELPAGARFCSNCGHRLAEEPAVRETAPVPPPPDSPAPASPLDRFMPRELLHKLDRARESGEMVGERRIVTMLFCDVKGSTAAAARFDPEDWAQIINGAFAPMIEPIYRYEGTVARLMGDGLLAFFGAPIAHEDDPQRAVLAGLEILDGIHAYRESVQREWGLDLDVRVGVNTGLVVVGAVGSDLRMEYSALGDAINIAARMEQTAQPGTVQIAPNTYKLIAPLFDFETIEGLEVKGRAEPMTAYRVLGRRTAPGALRGIAGLSSPLVGRDPELRQLTSALATLAAGRGGIVTVTGEAGLGKSRLVSEARRAAGVERAAERWLEGKAQSYDTATPYAPFRAVLAQSAGSTSEGGDGTYAGLKAAVERLLPGRGEGMAPFLAQAMSIAVPPGDNERVRYLPPPVLRGMVFQAVADWLAALAAERPTVLFLDDVHWADPSSLELLHILMPLTESAPLLLLLALRSRRQDASWQLCETASREYAGHYTPIDLRPLDASDSRALVRNLLAIEDLPESVRQLILDKSEGNPFFLEEVIRSLLDAGLVVRQGDHWRATREIIDLRVPDTLIGVITARLDRLDDASRQVAQAAAVLGREFRVDILAVIAGQGASLEESLMFLQRRGLIHEMGGLPARQYAFRHALTHDAAVESLLMSRRRHLHHRAADALRDHQPDAAADIARHYLEARQPAAALPYLVRAGQKAATGFAVQEAQLLFGQALEHEAAGDVATVRAAYEGLGAIQGMGADPRPALATYQRMLAAAEARGDLPMTVSALNKLGRLLLLGMGQFEAAEPYLARAEQLSANNADPDGFAEVSIVRCMICTIRADFDSVLEYMEGVVAGSLKSGNDYNRAFALAHSAHSLILLMRYDEAQASADEALALARRIGDRPHEAEVLASAYPLIHIRNGDFDQALASLEEGLRLARRIGATTSIIDSTWTMGQIALMRGDYGAALASGQRSMEAAAPLEDFAPFYLVHALSLLGLIYAEIGEATFDRATEFHGRASRLLEHPVGAAGGGVAWADIGWGALARGDLAGAAEAFGKGLSYPTMMMNIERPRLLAGMAQLRSAEGQHGEARRLAEEACAHAEENGLRHLVPLVRLTLGRGLAAAGHHESALTEFAVAEARAAAMTMRPLLRQAQAAAAGSLAALGRHDEAGRHSAAARQTIESIVALFDDSELRDAYHTHVAGRLVA